RAGYAQPRKQIHNVFSEELGLEPLRLRRVLDAAGVDPVARAQPLDLAQWEALYRAFATLYPEAIEMDDVPAAVDIDDEDADLDEWDADDAPDVHEDADDDE
ncbi:MAG: hypothetical protein AB7G21_13970, partial [Dehalococcoidia bacterium]